MASKNPKKPEPAALNILSFIRVRPLFSKEKKATNLELTKKEVVIKSSDAFRNGTKKLQFDRVFDEDVKQVAVYNTVVRPMVKEVLQGYNCTIFAYGQTGTGKTYTMSGELADNLQDCVHAGIIPRAMDEIFRELAEHPCEHRVTISYMELYNEKLRSLLSNSGEEIDIKIIDDPEGGVILKGLAATPVKSKEEAFLLLQQGTEKRQTAATLMNVNSSRSHTIFTISVNIKESNPVNEKDDVLRIGKLHLVDLAGSENVSKSGTSDASHKNGGGVNKRLTEASNINKSLLTLGRVITSITENSTHIPYRESKLTRFLRDSLGGRTKTCIIGTISPAQANIDETESTLNYAYKAKSIKNKPEKNLTISKKEFMQVATEEILKLKRDLEAVRQGDGYFISKETHEEMNSNMKSLSDQVQEWNERYNKLKDMYEDNKEMYSLLSSDLDDKNAEYEELQKIYQADCDKFKEGLGEMTKHIVVREFLISEYNKTESRLTKEACQCKTVLETIVEHNKQLHDDIDERKANETANLQVLNEFKTKINNKITEFHLDMVNSYDVQMTFLENLIRFSHNMLETYNESNDSIRRAFNEFNEINGMHSTLLNDAQSAMNRKITEELASLQVILNEGILNEKNSLRNIIWVILDPIRTEIAKVVWKIEQDIHSHLSEFELALVSQNIFKEQLMRRKETLDNSIKEIIGEFDAVEKEIQFAMENAMVAKEKALTAQKKAQTIMTLAQELKDSVDDVTETVYSIENSTQSVAHNVASLKSTTQKELAEQNYGAEDERTEFIAQQEKFIHHIPQTVYKIDQVMGLFGAIQDNAIESIESACTLQILSQENRRDRERTSVRNLMDAVNTSIAGLRNKIRGWTDDAQEQFCNIHSIIDDNENSMEINLRRDFVYISEQKDRTKEVHEAASSDIMEITSDLSRVNYKVYSPQGSTPPRIAIEDIQYPQSFSLSRPRNEYVDQFKDLAHCDLQSDEDWRKHVPAKLNKIVNSDGTFKKPLSPLREESPAHVRALLPKSLRRSFSAPDVNSPNFQDEDKENSVITSSKRGKAIIKPKNLKHIKRKICNHPLSEVNRSLPVHNMPTKGFK